MSFPEKSEREKCWSARDEYWKCLDKHNPKYDPNSPEPEPAQCLKLRKLFQTSCPSQWVKHFDRKRNYEQFKAQMAKGFDPVEQNTKR